MKNIIPVKFKDCSSLVEDLKKKSKDFPLIAKLYIPVIEKHVKNHEKDYDNLNIKFDDWLLIPYFQYLWRLEDFTYGRSCRRELDRVEEHLKSIRKSLGDDGFKKLCRDLLEFSMHPTVNGVHNKFLDFYGELRGMLCFINEEYGIDRIPRGSGKTPDFRAYKENEEVLVECKFIRKSNPIKTFFDRYIGYLKIISDFSRAKHIKSWDKFNYSVNLNDFDQSNISELKNFINDIIFESKKKEKLNLRCKCSCVIDYENKDEIEPNFVTIEDQVEFFGVKFREFLEDYCSRRVEQASKQFEDYSDKKQYVYILVELDEEYNMPLEEMDREKVCILKELKMKHGLELEVVLDLFPEINYNEKILKCLDINLIFDKLRFEKEINLLGEDISIAHILMLAIYELIEQSNLNFDVYKKYYDFFDLTYRSYWNELIHNVSRLQDPSRDCISIIKVLNRNIELDDEKSVYEKEILNKIQDFDVNKKIKVLRDKLGKAHLDGKVSINLEKQNKLWNENKTELKDVDAYIKLLTEALEVISWRLDKPIYFTKPNTPIKRQIRELFNNLGDKK